MKAYLHFGGPFTDKQPCSRLTTSTEEVKVNELEWQKKGIMYTSTGYGGKIPTRYMVKLLKVDGSAFTVLFTVM